MKRLLIIILMVFTLTLCSCANSSSNSKTESEELISSEANYKQEEGHKIKSEETANEDSATVDSKADNEFRFFEKNDVFDDYYVFLALDDNGDITFVQYPRNFSSFNLDRNEKLEKKADELVKDRTLFLEGYFSAVKEILKNEEIKLIQKNNNNVSYDDTDSKALLAFEGKENGRFIKILENNTLIYSNRDKNGASVYEIPKRDFDELIRLTRFFKASCDHMLDLEVDLLRKYQ